MFGAYWNYCQISDGVLYYTGLRPTENEVHSMNKTFKIVFNKARGALMVANEITGSVQKKGVPQIATAIALGLVSLSSFAAAPHPFVNWDADGTNPSSGFAFNLTDVPEDYPVGILISGNASGSISNADISLVARNANHPYPAAVRTLYQRGVDSNVTFDGDFTNVSLDTDYSGSGNSEASTFTNYAGIANFNAKNTTFTSKTDYKNGKFVIALEAYGVDGKSEINLNGDTVTLTAESNVDRVSATAKDKNRRGAVEGIGAFKNATINSSANVFTVNVSSFGETVAPTQELGTDNKYLDTAPDGKVGAADAVGFAAGGGQIKIANKSYINVNAVGGTATGLDAYDSYYTSTTGVVDLDGAGIILDDATIKVTSEKSVATGIKGSQTVSDGVLVNIRGNLQLTVASSQDAAYGINLDGGRSVIGAAGKDVVINVSSPSALSRNVWVHNGGNLSFGQEGNKVNSVTLNNKGTGDSDPFFIARIDKGSTLNVYANSYSQTGSGHGLYVVGDSATLNMDVDSFISSSAYTAIHTREAETATANINAKLFQATATATSDETGVSLLQFNEGSTINVTADDVSLTGTRKLGGGVMGTGSWGTVNLTANNSMVLNGNINGVYGAMDNNGKTAAFNIKAKTLSLNGDINIGSLNESSDSTKTDGAVSNFSRNTNVSVAAEQASITGNINVWGNSGKYDNSNDSNVVDLQLGDGSVITGDVSIIGQGQSTNQVAITATGTNKNLSFKGNISATNQGSLILNGGTYNVGALKLENRGTLTLDEGRLVTAGNQVFKSFVLNQSVDSLVDGLTLNDSELALTDTGTISQSFYESAAEKVGGNTLNFLNATITLADSNNELSLMSKKLAVGSLTGNDATKVILGDGSKLTLHGTNQTTNLEAVDITGGSSLALINSTTLDTSLLTGGGDVQVGDATGSGATLRVGTLGMTGGSIFVDPADTTHAYLEVRKVQDDTLKTAITAGHGSLISLNATLSDAQAAAAALQSQGLTATGAMAYVGTTLTLGEGGKLTIDAGAVAASNEPRVDTCADGDSTSVVLADNSTLIINQSTINGQVFRNATMSLEGGQIGIVNATAGTILLTDSDDMVTGSAEVLTDTPFIEATLSGNTITNTVSTTGGLAAIGSTSIQAMTRRADTVLAQTIADRTSVDQELAAGTNLWVDVTGERYEADKLDNGGEFKSDMGYGAFGADFAVTQDITAGAAFQYGKGSLRSGVSSIKNSIDSYGVTAYGAMKFGDAKVVAEASYIKNENDITSSQTALNQSVDSEIYSVGVRGQHRFTAGNFQFVPSVGVRVSRLNTDAMQVGAVNIKKQEQTLVQVPIALRVNGFEQNVSGWSVAPSFKIAYVPTFGDKEISVLGADQTVIDTSPVQGDFGIRAQNGNLMVNANMMLGGGKDGTSSVGGKVGLKYVF